MRPRKLNDDEIVASAASTPNWSIVGDELQRDFEFPDFVSAMAFVNRVADRAESMNHHPDIDIRYNRVKFVLSTHDAGGLTANDFELARLINAIAM